MGSLSLLQEIFPIQELNQGLLHCRWIIYQLNYQGSGQIVFWQIILSRFSVPPSKCYSMIERFSLQILTPFDHFSLLILFTRINGFLNPTYKITCPELFTLMGQAHCFLSPELACKNHQNLITYLNPTEGTSWILSGPLNLVVGDLLHRPLEACAALHKQHHGILCPTLRSQEAG